MSELIAYKSNSLIEASYKLTLQEQRLLLMCIGKINPQDSNQKKKFQITAKEFYLEFPAIGLGHAERHLHDAVNKLAERWIYLRCDTEEREIRWIQEKARYFTGEGKVEIVFADSIMPYLTQLQQQFTKIVVKNVSNLKSVYSIRIYELLMQFKSIGDRLLNIDDFRSILFISDKKYSSFKSLSQWVIKPAIKELNAKSDINVSVDLIKQGRKVVALHFHFEEKNKKQSSDDELLQLNNAST
ncbi:replication initiation protein (plasmid) [Arsenophonus nasoniae]|uniref:replication initiation protein n=1 Tax=Arsenophonus nasoniae TaxID=638 RepID=UPI00246994D6|nr:replication initiation protein [Arsenophonus nasoniae]WGM18551.1 replication initiation protein [Arsenophonus nasoniae]